MSVARRYIKPVPNRSIAITSISIRVWEDPTNIDGHIQDAVVYVDDDEWVDCFELSDDTYEMTVCPCLYPSIVCRAMDDEADQDGATSWQVMEIITGFKASMGTNYRILNALRKKEEVVGMGQQDHDGADQVAVVEQEVEQQPSLQCSHPLQWFTSRS